MQRAMPQPTSAVCLASVAAFACMLCILAALAIVDAVFPLRPQTFGLICLFALAATTYLTWRQTEQGNHPVFLFMVFLALFQFGRMFSWFISGDWSMGTFDLAVSRPFTVADADLKLAMLLVPLSAAFVYLGFFLTAGRKVLTFAKNDDMRTFFAALYYLTVPFVVFKDISYLRYTIEHGGYLATYLNEGEHVAQVGLAVRSFAMLNAVAFLPYLILEDRKRPLQIAIASFLLVLTLELLVGVRGKFFIHLMFLWTVYNIKTRSSFTPMAAVVGGLTLAGAAVAAELFRESKNALDVNLVGYFFYTQGNSFFVTVSALIYRDVLDSHAVAYLANQFLSPFVHVSKFPDGALLTRDLTSFLNPDAARFGFGTGDGYLANLYLLGGYCSVSLGSFVIGLLCARLTRVHGVFWQTIALVVLMWIPYLPRSGYLEPLANAVKYTLLTAIAFAGYALFASLRFSLSAAVANAAWQEHRS